MKNYHVCTTEGRISSHHTKEEAVKYAQTHIMFLTKDYMNDNEKRKIEIDKLQKIIYISRVNPY